MGLGGFVGRPRGPEFHTKSPPWSENHTKTADPENHTTHAENGLKITLDSLENALILNKNTERTVGCSTRLVLQSPPAERLAELEVGEAAVLTMET